MSAEAAVAPPSGIAASAVPAPVQPYADDFAARAEAREAEPEALQALRERGFSRFAELGFPSMRQEAWRFTNVGPLARTAFVRATPRPVTKDDAAPWLYAGTAHLVVVDGVVAPELSDTAGLPPGVTFVSLREAITAGHPAIEQLGRHAAFDDAPFAALNTALFEDGVLLHVGRGVALGDRLAQRAEADARREPVEVRQLGRHHAVDDDEVRGAGVEPGRRVVARHRPRRGAHEGGAGERSDVGESPRLLPHAGEAQLGEAGEGALAQRLQRRRLALARLGARGEVLRVRLQRAGRDRRWPGERRDGGLRAHAPAPTGAAVFSPARASCSSQP